MGIQDYSDTAPDPQVVALLALGHIVGDERLGARFLDLSGITVPELRQSADSLEIQLAALDFLAAHEPDLLACAAAIGLTPAQITAARSRLHGSMDDKARRDETSWNETT